MSNSFFGSNLSKLDRIKLKEYEEDQKKRMINQSEDEWSKQIEKEEMLRDFNESDWPEMHGAYQDKNGQWQI